jgi:hypothetical protein
METVSRFGQVRSRDGRYFQTGLLLMRSQDDHDFLYEILMTHQVLGEVAMLDLAARCMLPLQEFARMAHNDQFDLYVTRMLSAACASGDPWAPVPFILRLYSANWIWDDEAGQRVETGCYYRVTNDWLRSIKRLTQLSHTEVLEQMDCLALPTELLWCSVLARMQDVPEGMVLWRGLDMCEDAIQALEDCRDSHGVLLAFTSFSMERAVAERFIQPKTGTIGVLIEYHTRRGAFLDGLTEHDGEREVLFPPLTMVLIRNVHRPGGDRAYWILELHDVPPSRAPPANWEESGECDWCPRCSVM